MELKPCDSCGGPLAIQKGQDVYFVVRVQISKATAWGVEDRAAAEKMIADARRLGLKRLADAASRIEPGEIIGDRVPALMTHADLRICARCVEKAALKDPDAGGIDLLGMVRASEFGSRDVPSSKTA